MKTSFATFTLLAATTFAAAQDTYHEPSAKTKQYYEYRNELTKPGYGLKKVETLVKSIKRKDSEDDLILPLEKFNSLSFEEKFTYVMIHAEEFSQNCDAMPEIEGAENRIFPYPAPGFSGDMDWSENQRKFLHDNRAKVLGLIRATIKAQNRVGANLKNAIIELDAVELVPMLVEQFKQQQKDKDILTVLMLLMKEHKYAPFMTTNLYKTFYGENANYQASLPAVPANEKLILVQAASFSKSRRK